MPSIRRLLNATLVGLAVSESIAVYGFVLFMIGGRAGDYYVFAALALVGFVLYLPRREAWDERARTLSR